MTTFYVIMGIAIYIIGCVLYCIMFHNDIGKIDYVVEYWGAEEHIVDSTDIVFQSMFWPMFLFLVVAVSPFIVGPILLDKYHENHIEKHDDRLLCSKE